MAQGRVAAARDALASVARVVQRTEGDDPAPRLERAYADAVRALADSAIATDDANLYHDDLSDQFAAVSVSEFAASEKLGAT